jgi:hypothetical protein
VIAPILDSADLPLDARELNNIKAATAKTGPKPISASEKLKSDVADFNTPSA